MASIGGSIEENIAKKLKFNELDKPNQVQAGLQYLQDIIEGKLKTTPPELKGLFNLLYELLAYDSKATITKYIMQNDSAIQVFFKNNFQRFDHFEFKPYLLKLKGEDPAKAYQVPLNARRNFEKIQPLDIRPYVDMLESNPAVLKATINNTLRTDPQKAMEAKQAEAAKLNEQLFGLQKQIKSSIEKGILSRDIVLAGLRYAEESCIPALQMKYNKEAVEELAGALLAETTTNKSMSAIFEELKVPWKLREKFCDLLKKKVTVSS